MAATIILLNGVGSAGKGSIAKALQEIATEPFMHVEMDAFLEMLPAAYQDHPDGLSFETALDNGHPSVHARTGAVAEQLLKGMRQAVAGMASAGNNLIVDEVLFGNVTTEFGNPATEYRTLLAPYQLHFVGVFATLDVLEERERSRGDRMIGLARWQFDRVHEGMDYDLMVDTSNHSATECAQQIKDHFAL